MAGAERANTGWDGSNEVARISTPVGNRHSVRRKEEEKIEPFIQTAECVHLACVVPVGQSSSKDALVRPHRSPSENRTTRTPQQAIFGVAELRACVNEQVLKKLNAVLP